MSPEEKARRIIDEQLKKSGWIIQDMKELNLSAGRGVALESFLKVLDQWIMLFLWMNRLLE